MSSTGITSKFYDVFVRDPVSFWTGKEAGEVEPLDALPVYAGAALWPLLLLGLMTKIFTRAPTFAAARRFVESSQIYVAMAAQSAGGASSTNGAGTPPSNSGAGGGNGGGGGCC